MRRSSLRPWVLAAVAVVLGVSAFVLDALAGSHGDGWWLNVLAASALVATAGVGLLVAVRRPDHPIGWLLQATAILLAASGTAQGYAEYSVLEQPGALPGAEWAVLWDQSAWPLLFGALIAIVLVFPDGRLPSPRWRRAMIGAAAAFALLVTLGLFASEPFEAPYENVDRPLPALPGAFEVLWPVAFLGVLASLVAGVQAVRVRFRRARGTERLQLKWLTFTAALVPVTLLICLSGSLLGGSADGDAFNGLFFFMLGAIPASIGVAVLRYRLYDIDRVINRTLVYGVLTVLLATAYGATALLLGTALGSGSAWATAGATLLVAVAFRPLRGAVQDAVDRRFNRARYDARRRVAGFLEDLRAGRAAPEAIEPVLRDVLSDPRLELRFFLPETELYVDARGYPAGDQPEDGRLRTPVTRGGAPLGTVLHSPFDEEDRPGLLNEVLEVAGLAIEIARLRVALRRQLDEVQASRARIVAAGYEERRRLERDLHDGAQQRLISIGLALRHAQHELGVAPDRASASIGAAVSEIAVASEELRELARGVRPAQLDAGLAPALEELAARAPLPVEVWAGGDRYPDEIEAAAYFIASEGLTNVVKHSEAGCATLSASRRNGCLVISVSDDGVGGASPAAGGSGLRGLSDRVEAHGGRFAIESGPHGGTVLTAELPCG